MSNTYSQFKQFTVNQERCAMKVGTDGVVLGVLSDAYEPSYILDIGTGTGLVALMMAQRFSQAVVDAVEIVEEAAQQAEENASNSKFASRIHIYQSDINIYRASHRYDLIVSNPPYFCNSLLNPDEARATARHTQSLSYENLVDAAARLININGVFAVIVPSEAREQLRYLCELSYLHLISETYIRTTERKHPQRIVMQFVNGKAEKLVQHTLTLQDSTGKLTPEFELLTYDFYLDK